MKTFFATLACTSAALAINTSSLRGSITDSEPSFEQPTTCKASLDWLREEKERITELKYAYEQLLELQTTYGVNIGGEGAFDFLCWGIYHAYNGVSTKEIRDPTPDLKNAFVEEIIDTTAMELAIA